MPQDETADEPLSITAVPIEAPRVAAVGGRYIGQLFGGKYRLVKLLGQGAMGEVYKARLEGGDQVVAVKVMLPQAAAVPEQVARFRREAFTIARLAHPNIVRVFELGEDRSRRLFFLVMEFLSGRSLEEWLRALPAPPALAEVRGLMGAVMGAIEFAHERGVVHRDLKPGNVFLAEEGGQIAVKVLDFGLARVTPGEGVSLTRTDMVAGTPQYMSPEQCKSLKVGPSTDIYALGCLLTELLQLEPPFQGGAPMELVARHMFVPAPPLVRPAGAEPVPPALEQLRLGLLAKDPAQRPLRVADARERLLAALAGV